MSNIAIVGAGPAGLGCAYALAQENKSFVVVDREHIPGGLCRTINHHGYLFDIGGHRFLTQSQEVSGFWKDIMGDDLLTVKRLSRIYYNHKYFNYPLSFLNTFVNLGPVESLRCVLSYLWCKTFRPGNDQTFDGWITNEFGKRLYDIFFKTYTEKVWAVACRDISAEWARQRIRGLSLRVAIQNAFGGFKKNKPATLAEQFLYPRQGPGDLYKRLADRLRGAGKDFLFDQEVVAVNHRDHRIMSIDARSVNSGHIRVIPVEYLFSSMPLPQLVNRLNPLPPKEILEETKKLRFRSYIVVNIVLNKEHVFPDQWLYIHSPAVKMGRIQNYKNWSPAMTVDWKETTLGLEYFCTQGDDFWNMRDENLIKFAVAELERLGIASCQWLAEGFVVKCADVYPVYDLHYPKHVNAVRQYLEKFSNLQTMGRAGLFRYDNSDHALLTGIYAARNMLGKTSTDIWKMNIDQKYLES